jgi:hypothetical protein
MKTTINKKLRGIAAALLLIGLVPSNMMAQDKVEASVGADLVSGYIWSGFRRSQHSAFIRNLLQRTVTRSMGIGRV